MGGERLGMVGSAADAFRVWRAAGLRGRRLVVLSGQWSRPRDPKAQPPTPAEMAAGLVGEGGVVLDDRSALFVAARLGLTRAFDVVMPPRALARRLGEVAARKELVREEEGFRLSHDGLERRFSTPSGFAPPRETALVLVEPSWFDDGAPADPLGWLRDRGVAWDLALVALADPAATPEQRQAALAYGQSAGARFWETGE